MFKIKNILPVVYTIPFLIKTILGKTMRDFILNVLRLFILTTIVPVAGTLTMIVWSLLGGELIHTLFDNIYILWKSYYFSGHFFGIPSWRYHLIFLIFCIFLSLPKKY